MMKPKSHFKGLIIKLIIFLSTLTIQFSHAQDGENKINCIQGIWRGVTMDIEPHADLSNFYQIIQGDSIFSFYLDKEKVFKSYFQFVNFDIQQENIDFYEVKEENILTINEENDNSYLYTEIDSDRNIAVDKFFICGKDFMIKLHFEFERQPFLPYVVYSYLNRQSKIDGHDYINELKITNKLKKAKVTVEKAFFYNAPSESTKRKAFVVKGDELIIDDIKKDWVKVAYIGKTTTTEGWIKSTDLQIID